MMKQIRQPAPQKLAENWEQWGRAFAEGKGFHWHSLHTELCLILLSMTRGHCSFCDVYGLGSEIQESIEHFKPKSAFKTEAYQWENLFICCGVCQSAKLEKYDIRLLKPDEAEYDFYSYFEVDESTCKIHPQRGLSKEMREAAQATIDIYKLNERERPQQRLEKLKLYRDLATNRIEMETDKMSYRFLF